MYKKLFSLVVVLACLGVSAAGAGTARNVSPEEASALLGKGVGVYLLDVRTPQEYQQFRLADAQLIPIDQIERRLAEIPKGRPILVYCAVGSRSAQVFNFLARSGYAEVYNLDGGIYGWMQRGYPVLKGNP